MFPFFLFMELSGAVGTLYALSLMFLKFSLIFVDIFFKFPNLSFSELFVIQPVQNWEKSELFSELILQLTLQVHAKISSGKD